MNRHILSAQLHRFLVTGVAAAVIDSSVYLVLLYAGVDFSLAKACSFLSAIAFAYNGHRRWTFSTHGSRKRITGFISLYMTTFLINIITNTLMLDLLGKDRAIDIAGAFIVATGLTATVNFTIMKLVIFRSPKHSHAINVQDTHARIYS